MSFRLLLTVLALSLCFDGAYAKDWSKKSETVDFTRDPKGFWKATAKASECYSDPFFIPGIQKGLTSPRKFTANTSNNLNYIRRLSPTGQCRTLIQRPRIPKPLVDAEIDSDYHGNTKDRFQVYYEFLALNIAANRDGTQIAPQERLIEFLANWSEQNALSKNIRFSGIKAYRLDYHVQALLPLMIVAYSDTAKQMTADQRLSVGSWLNRLVGQSQKSSFTTQDNKNYLRHYTAMLWGILVGDDRLIDQARKAYRSALYYMRPDGTFPTDVARGGMGLHYQNLSVNVLVTMAAASQAIGEDWINMEVNGRSLHDAVGWLVKANQDKSLNRQYARSCPSGSFGTIEEPNLHYREKPGFSGESDSSWVELYLKLTTGSNKNREIASSLNWSYDTPLSLPQYAIWSKALGPQNCIWF
ncbi:alginate lyase family protein [Alphaproteobacteria bacterium LSUCC0719]